MDETSGGATEERSLSQDGQTINPEAVAWTENKLHWQNIWYNIMLSSHFILQPTHSGTRHSDDSERNTAVVDQITGLSQFVRRHVDANYT